MKWLAWRGTEGEGVEADTREEAIAAGAKALFAPPDTLGAIPHEEPDPLLGWTKTEDELPEEGRAVLLASFGGDRCSIGEVYLWRSRWEIAWPVGQGASWLVHGIGVGLQNWPLWRYMPPIPGEDAWKEEEG